MLVSKSRPDKSWSGAKYKQQQRKSNVGSAALRWRRAGGWRDEGDKAGALIASGTGHRHGLAQPAPAAQYGGQTYATRTQVADAVAGGGEGGEDGIDAVHAVQVHSSQRAADGEGSLGQQGAQLLK